MFFWVNVVSFVSIVNYVNTGNTVAIVNTDRLWVILSYRNSSGVSDLPALFTVFAAFVQHRL